MAKYLNRTAKVSLVILAAIAAMAFSAVTVICASKAMAADQASCDYLHDQTPTVHNSSGFGLVLQYELGFLEALDASIDLVNSDYNVAVAWRDHLNSEEKHSPIWEDADYTSCSSCNTRLSFAAAAKSNARSYYNDAWDYIYSTPTGAEQNHDAGHAHYDAAQWDDCSYHWSWAQEKYTKAHSNMDSSESWRVDATNDVTYANCDIATGKSKVGCTHNNP